VVVSHQYLTIADSNQLVDQPESTTHNC